MKVLLVHPSCLLYSEIYLRLEPLGLERVAQAVRTAGHDVRLLDLQVSHPTVYVHEISTFQPQAIGFSLNYLANVPEVVELAKATKARLPHSFIFVGGHSASFIPHELLQHAQGAIDCVVRGEGEVSTPQLLEAIPDGAVETIPGVVTLEGTGPPPLLLDSLDHHFPARDLVRQRLDVRRVDREDWIEQVRKPNPLRFRDESEQGSVAVETPRTTRFGDLASGLVGARRVLAGRRSGGLRVRTAYEDRGRCTAAARGG